MTAPAVVDVEAILTWLDDALSVECKQAAALIRKQAAQLQERTGQYNIALARMAEQAAQIAELQKDAERYREQFSTGEWDYMRTWIGKSKVEVDAAIDEAITASEPPKDS